MSTLATWDSSEPVVLDGDEDLKVWLGEGGHFRDHYLFRTSGSSGIEKWVALSKGALEWSARAVISELAITGEDVLGLALPEVHVGGFGVVLRAKLAGARLVRFEGRWSPEGFAEWVVTEGVTVTSLVPTQVHDLVKAGLVGGARLRVMVVGGGVMGRDLRDAARELAWPVVPSYGMTETGAQVATGDGLPLIAGWEAKIVKGCLALKGGGLLTGVIRRGDDGFVVDDPKQDGWFSTQDRAELEGRYLTILGRRDRQVKVLGKLVDLDLLEEYWKGALKGEVAILARRCERRENRLVLVVEGDERRVEGFNEGLLGPERAAEVRFLRRLPRSALGKIDRAALVRVIG